MAKRQGSMATIDDALNQTIVVNENPIAPPPDASAPHAAPGVNAPTPETGEKPETRVLTAEEIAEEKNKSEREKLIDEAIKERERQEQERKDAFKASANNVVDKTGQVWRGATARLGSIPTPGSIILPLVALLVFFFMLIPVNGHTRFVWLWLVLTGNADITGGGASGNFGNTAGGASGDFGTPSYLSQFPQATTIPIVPGGASSAALNAVLQSQGNVEQPARNSQNGFLAQFPQAQVTPVRPTFFTGPEDTV